MKVIINGATYNDVTWKEKGFTMQTDMTLSEIADAFVPGTNTDIIVMDGTQEIARYYNKGLESIQVTGNNPRLVTVMFDLTQISGNAETEIRESMEYSDEAITELAEMIAGIEEANFPALYEEIKQYFTSRMREEDQIFYNFDIRIRALETNAGIVSIEKNEEE